MSKKELRKELELTLLKSLEEVLNKKDVEATKNIRKTIHLASKMVAKKFLKFLKPVEENNKIILEKIIKKAIIPVKKIIVPSRKKSIVKTKLRSTK